MGLEKRGSMNGELRYRRKSTAMEKKGRKGEKSIEHLVDKVNKEEENRLFNLFFRDRTSILDKENQLAAVYYIQPKNNISYAHF